MFYYEVVQNDNIEIALSVLDILLLLCKPMIISEFYMLSLNCFFFLDDSESSR